MNHRIRLIILSQCNIPDEILDQIAALRDETGITVILVSHSMDDVAKYVDRIVVMNQGGVMYDDEPVNVFRYYKELEAVGLAAPQVTYIMQALKEKGFPVRTDIITIEEAKNEILHSPFLPSRQVKRRLVKIIVLQAHLL